MRGLSSSCSRQGQCRRCAYRGSGHQKARRTVTPRTRPPAPPGAADAAAHSGGATDTTRLLPRSHRDPQRGEILLYLSGRPVVVDVCVTHPLASSAAAAAAWGTGVAAEAKDALKRDKYGRTGTGSCGFVPRFHETQVRAGPLAFALLHEVAEFAASARAVSNKMFMDNAMRDLYMMLCRGIGGQVLSSAPLRARLDGRTVLPGRPVPTDGLAYSSGPAAGLSSRYDGHLQPRPASVSMSPWSPPPPPPATCLPIVLLSNPSLLPPPSRYSPLASAMAYPRHPPPHHRPLAPPPIRTSTPSPKPLFIHAPPHPRVHG